MVLLVQLNSTYSNTSNRVLYLFVCPQIGLSCISRTSAKVLRVITPISITSTKKLEFCTDQLPAIKDTCSSQDDNLDLSEIANQLTKLVLNPSIKSDIEDNSKSVAVSNRPIYFNDTQSLPCRELNLIHYDDYSANDKSTQLDAQIKLQEEEILDEAAEENERSYSGSGMASYYEILKLEPNAVLYYDVGGLPLVNVNPSSSTDSKSVNEICSLCGKQKLFETQIFGSLLYDLCDDTDTNQIINKMKFSFIEVYSCSVDCYNFNSDNFDVIEETAYTYFL